MYSWSVLQPESNLSVLVFIHGGAFIRVRKILHWYYYTIGSVTNCVCVCVRERERERERDSWNCLAMEAMRERKTAGIGYGL